MKLMYAVLDKDERKLYWCWLGAMHEREYVLFVGLYWIEVRISWPL